MSTQFSGRITPVMQRVLDALARDGDMEAEELAEASCTCHNTLSGGGYLRKMLAMELIRVSGWKRNAPGAPTPIYSTSEGKSVNPPRAYSRVERTRRWKKKVAYGSPEWARRQSLKQLVMVTCS